MIVQGNAGAALLGKQKLPALVLVHAGIVVAEQGGDADDRCWQAVGVERCVGGEPGHKLSDLMGKLSKFG